MGKLLGGCRLHKGGVVGWIKDDADNNSLELEAWVGNKDNKDVIWSAVADTYRPDLEKKKIGDGKYGFVFQIPSKVFDLEKNGRHFLADKPVAVHICTKGSGEEIPGSPVMLDASYWDYRKLLVSMVGLPIFGLIADQADGKDLGLFGYALAPEGSASDYHLYVNGETVVRHEVPAVYDRIVNEYRRFLWFIKDYEDLGFYLEVDRDKYTVTDPVDNTRLIKIGFGRTAEEAMDPLRAVYIPEFPEGEIVLPDRTRRARVMAQNEKDTNFLALGYSHYRYYREIFERYSGRPWNSITRMMDWGCGCGRVSQYLIRSLPEGALLGVDIDEDNVGWCNSYLKKGVFEKGPLVPPLDIKSNSLDYIVATSVFTHLMEEVIELWLEELQRVLKPGGVAALTVASDSRVAWNLRDADWVKALQEKGVDDSIVSHDLDGHVENEYYRNVKVTKKFIHEKWGKFFIVHDIVEHVFGYQDVVVCQKK